MCPCVQCSVDDTLLDIRNSQKTDPALKACQLSYGFDAFLLILLALDLLPKTSASTSEVHEGVQGVVGWCVQQWRTVQCGPASDPQQSASRGWVLGVLWRQKATSKVHIHQCFEWLFNYLVIIWQIHPVQVHLKRDKSTLLWHSVLVLTFCTKC